SGLAIALATAAWLMNAPRGPADHATGGDAEVATSHERSLLKDRTLVLLTMSYAGLCYFKYLFFYWMQFYFHVVLAQSKEASRLSATIPTLALAAGMFGGGWVADRLQDRWGRRRGLAAVPACGLTLSAVFLLAGVEQDKSGWAVASFSLALAAAGMCEGPFWTSATVLGGRHGGTAAAVSNAGANVGGLLAPVITPLVAARLGWSTGLALASIFCLGSALLWLWIDPYREIPPPGRNTVRSRPSSHRSVRHVGIF
ncbi:MAG TPA: MFS transporter, partial [Candidatus Methylomirabilis sp.]|nr:MFS transporter [Candidatus Methylomirabilis sp.]